jgi:hypothetical protein
MHYLKLCYRPPRSEALPCEEESLICASDDATNESFENSGNELVW